MTLSPVFRSREAVRLLAEDGVWSRLAPDLEAQAQAVRVVCRDFEEVLGDEFRTAPRPIPTAEEIDSPLGLSFLQEYFFLILFRSVFRTLEVEPGRLDCYTELNFCIKGTITAADNLFDDQDKSLLPLRPQVGPRFSSILQLMSFERLGRAVLDRAEARGTLGRAEAAQIQRNLLDRMARIGALEGSEEGGVDEIPDPDTMVERVHRVRGGALFALAFAAPRVLETGEAKARLALAEQAIARLGTAFQIVDDVTDFEFDVRRRSHNLLVSEIRHHGSAEERRALEGILHEGNVRDHGVERVFRRSARAVLDRAYTEARASFGALRALGHWLEPELAERIVHAIVGLDGVVRMESLAAEG